MNRRRGLRSTRGRAGAESSGLADACLWALLLPSVLPAAPTSAIRRDVTLVARPGVTAYQLPDQFLFVGTDSVFSGDSLLPRSGYAIDYDLGRITLIRALPDSAVLRVIYQRYPARGLKTSYFQRTTPAETALAEAPPPAPESAPGVAPPAGTEELTANGSKTITLSAGTSGLDLDQALRLDLKGNLAGLDLDAVLSDQNTGLSPEGTTRELAELDKVAVTLKGRGISGSVGDFDLTQDFGRLGQVNRRMRGLQLGAQLPAADTQGARYGIIRAEASYAKPKGRYGHNEIQGLDGRQGPYLLSGDLPGVSVVPGSEEVFLDGRPMTRGWDNDYTIDFTTGELTFTNRHQINGRSRIEVDFQYTTDEYDRTTLGGTAAYRLGSADLSLGVLSEGDDKSSHLTGDLSAADQESLARVGDTSSLAWLPGADSVGTGKGDYRRQGDHFGYAGPDSGDFQVAFTPVGDSGDYVYDNDSACYLYAGPGSGQYVARRRVRLPGQTSLFDANLGWSPGAGFAFSFNGGLTSSRANLFSTAAPVSGLGYEGAVSWQKGGLGLSYERRSIGPDFRFPGQVEERDFAYKWNLQDLPATYLQDEVTATARPLPPLGLDLGAGWLRGAGSAGRFDRKRGHAGLSAWFADYRFDRVGALNRHFGEVSPKIDAWNPHVSARLEYDTGGLLSEIVPGLGWTPRDGVQVGASWQTLSQSGKDSSGPGWLERDRLSVVQGELHLSGVRNLDLQSTAGYLADRVRGAAQDRNQIFASLLGTWSSPAGFRVNANLDQKYEQAVLKREVYVRVDTGKGGFSFNPETRQYYPDTLGPYARRVVPTGATAPARTSTVELSAGVTHWEWLDLELSGAVNQQIADSVVLTDNWNGNARFQLFPQQPVSLTLADDAEATAGQSTYLGAERDLSNQASAEVRLTGGNDLSATARLEVPLKQAQDLGGALVSRDLGITGQIEPRIGYGVELNLKAGYGVRTIEMPGRVPAPFHLQTLTLGASRRFQLRPGISLDADLLAESRRADISRLPYELTLSDPLGWSEQLVVNVDRMLGSALVISGGYTFNHRPGLPAEHTVSANLKAYF